MKHRIDPTVDCVFKAILGSEHHKDLLIHFINSILGYHGEDRVVEVALLNPYNPKDHLDGKMSVVDIKAVDQRGRQYQLEIQLTNHPGLAERMLFNWVSIYYHGIDEGQTYTQLTPLISIWLLAENLFDEIEMVHIPFGIYSPRAGIHLTDHFGIHLLQLKKQSAGAKISNDKDRWIKLFREGKDLDLDHPPNWLDTPEMRTAMSVMRTFSEKEESYHLYLERLDAQRVALTWQTELAAERAAKEQERAAKERERAAKEQERAAKEQERAAKEQERAAKEQERAEKLRLRALLERAGIDPDQGQGQGQGQGPEG